MTEADILKKIEELAGQNKALSDKLEALTEEDDLEKDFEYDEKPRRSQMLDIDPSIVDGYGHPIQLVTKSRITDTAEAYNIAVSFVEDIYGNMSGNRFGKHSILTPVFNDDGSKNKIDMVWFAGCPVRVVEIDGKIFYKILVSVTSVLKNKLLSLRIPVGGVARQEEINYIGAEKSGNKWTQENNPMQPMKPVNYHPPTNKTTMRNVGELVYE